MEVKEKNPNSIYIFDDLLEDILLRLPLKPILTFKTVSKRWRSILESNKFVERRMSLQKSRKILAAYNCNCGVKPRLLSESRFIGDEEILYLHCDAARPWMTCDGLVCIPEQGWIIVFNPWTRQLRRFNFGSELWSWDSSPENRIMGFGRDKVTGSYKVVKVEVRAHRVVDCSVLDVETGEWWMLSTPPPNKVDAGRKSVSVNGSIYWLQNLGTGYKILALDLHKQEFHNVTAPDMSVTQETEISNLEGRLAIAITYTNPPWKLEIWSMDTEEETWSKTYSIGLDGKGVPREIRRRWFTPVAVSKQGNLVFCDNHKRLFKHYPRTDEIRCLSSDTCVISPFFENLAPLPLNSTLLFPHPRTKSECHLLSKRNEFQILDLVITTLLVVGSILLPLILLTTLI